MGTDGKDRFGDYDVTRSGPGGGEGGGGTEDPCEQEIAAMLEEVERCEYYQQHKAPPEIGTRLTVRLGKRLRVETADGELVGYLSTIHNHLATCIKSGYSYSGSVTSTASSPILRVEVAILPAKQ